MRPEKILFPSFLLMLPARYMKVATGTQTYGTRKNMDGILIFHDHFSSSGEN